MKISKIISGALVAACLSGTTACNEKSFEVTGQIEQAADSLLYFEQMGLNGPVVIDSVKLSADGHFSFSAPATQSPEFYRLRIASQMVNVAIDSTETVTVKAQYPTMSAQYTVEGSAECAKIKDLVGLQMQLQQQVNSIVDNPSLGVQAVEDSVNRVVERYKNNIKLNYIFKEPMKAYAYFALFQTIQVGNATTLIFNPRNNEADVKVFAAVATSWDTYFPKAERGLNLHNIAIEGMKNIRIIRSQQAQTIDMSKVDQSGIINIALADNKGKIQNLSALKGRVVLLDFHLFAQENSIKRIMMLRELYNKYHARGFEIYQVSVDPDEHFWKTQTAALPWICVRDADGPQSINLRRYNVQSIPTFFLLDKNVTPVKRDVQITDIDAEIQALL